MVADIPTDISVDTLDAMRRNGDAFALVDVREPWEVELCAIEGSINIPMGQLPLRVGEIPSDRPVVMMCHHGFRSAQAAAWLRARGIDGVANLSGGIDDWARRIDSTMKVY